MFLMLQLFLSRVDITMSDTNYFSIGKKLVVVVADAVPHKIIANKKTQIIHKLLFFILTN